jgi:hypothetical protein
VPCKSLPSSCRGEIEPAKAGRDSGCHPSIGARCVSYEGRFGRPRLLRLPPRDAVAVVRRQSPSTTCWRSNGQVRLVSKAGREQDGRGHRRSFAPFASSQLLLHTDQTGRECTHDVLLMSRSARNNYCQRGRDCRESGRPEVAARELLQGLFAPEVQQLGGGHGGAHGRDLSLLGKTAVCC